MCVCSQLEDYSSRLDAAFELVSSMLGRPSVHVAASVPAVAVAASSSSSAAPGSPMDADADASPSPSSDLPLKTKKKAKDTVRSRLLKKLHRPASAADESP